MIITEQDFKAYRNKPLWELKNIKRALTKLSLLNTKEDEKTLFIVNQVLKDRYFNIWKALVKSKEPDDMGLGEIWE